MAQNQPPRGGPMGGRTPTMGEKPKNFKKSLLKLIKFLKPFYPIIIIAIILAVCGTIFSVIAPTKIGEIGNIIGEGIIPKNNQPPSGIIDYAAIVKIAIFLVIIHSLAAVFSYIQGFIMATVTQKTSKSLRTKISKKINNLPLNYFDKTTVGNTLSRITNDVDLIGHALNQSAVSLITSITMLVGSLVAMFLISYIVALVAIFSSIIGFAVMTIIIKRSQKYFVGQQKTLGQLNGHIEEAFSGHNVIKAYNAEKKTEAQFNKLNTELYSSAWKSQFYSGVMMPLMSFVSNFGYVAVSVVCGALIFSGNLSIGAIMSFIIYVRLFTQPLSQIAQSATSLQSAAAASERVFEFLDEKELDEEKRKTKRLEFVKGEIEFKNVKFGYVREKIIINDFSAKVKAGQKIAIVGPTGAGKTTLVNLLMRFYEIDSGEILIDKVSTKDIKRENLRELFGMVLQDTWLFKGTIRENIVYSKQNVKDEDVEAACAAAGIDHYIKTLPHGYDTVLDENVSLSQGQAQLITIARAMVQNAPMLILDEATSSVDTRTEELIQKAMDKLSHGRTSFVIAHRLSTIKNADAIFVMKDGDIIEQGSHEELMQQGGFYCELYNSQFAEN